jgi:hypothetical protein
VKKSGTAKAIPPIDDDVYLILRDARVYLLAPGGDAAFDVVDVRKARVLK